MRPVTFKRIPLADYTCTEETLSLALFGKYGVIVKRLDSVNIKPEEFGFENVMHFIDIIPELKRCRYLQGSRLIPGDIIRTVPDSNLDTDERHSMLIIETRPTTVMIADEYGYRYVNRQQLEKEWDRTGRLLIRCENHEMDC